MAEALNRYLEDLRHRALLELEEDVAEALVQEVRLHLDASLRARLELGTAPCDAERETLDAFGGARELIARLSDVHEGRDGLLGAHRPTMYWATACVAWTLLLLLVGPSLPSAALPIGLSILFSILFGGFLWQSYRSKRWQVLPLAGFGACTFVASAILMGSLWLNLWSAGGIGYVPVWQVEQYLRDSSSVVASLQPQVERFDAGYHAFRRDMRPPAEFVTQDGVLVPHHYARGGRQIEYRLARPGEDVWQAWRSMHVQRPWRNVLESAQRTLESVPAARATPLWRRWSTEAPGAAGFAAMSSAVLLAGNGIAAGLGILTRRRRRAPGARAT
jgi:hypothetical protein